MAKRKRIDHTLVRPNDPDQMKLLKKVKAHMKERGLSLSVGEDLKVLSEYDRLLSLMKHMRDAADKLDHVTQKMAETPLYKRLRAAEDKRNEKRT